MTYNQAIEKLGNREQKKIANNTYLCRRQDGAVAVRLHATDILTFRPDGSVVLTTGGWRSVTTKARLNAYCPIGRGIGQRAGVWYHGSTKVEMMEGDRINEATGAVWRTDGTVVL